MKFKKNAYFLKSNALGSINGMSLNSNKSFFSLLNLLTLSATLLVCFGAIVVYSAVLNDSEYSFWRQLLGIAIGVVLMLLCWRIDYRILSNMTWPILFVTVFLIMSPHIPGLGVSVKGAQSWIKLGIQIQPAEFAKITVIFLCSSCVSRYQGRLDNVVDYIKCLSIMLIPFVCIMTQPDLGTGLVYLFIATIALIAGGANLRFLITTLILCIIFLILILVADEMLKYTTESGNTEYHFLKTYQRQRLFVFIDPDNDTSDSGYNLKQAQIAIGSGGFFGKGLFNGTQAALKYLPEAPTDFIFCVLAEEFGFLGVIFLLILYAILIKISLNISKQCDELFGKMLIMCVIGMWVFQIFENIGMTCGLMPITGIPLPFISYGSSFMIVNFVMLGIIGSIANNSVVVKRKRIGYGSTGGLK